jgi:hypothetical protein
MKRRFGMKKVKIACALMFAEKVSVPAIVEIPIDIIGPLAIFGGVWGENCESNIPARFTP